MEYRGFKRHHGFRAYRGRSRPQARRDAHADLAELYLASLRRVDPYLAVKERLRLSGSTLLVRADEGEPEGGIEHGRGPDFSIDLSGFTSIVVLGVGKASGSMAAGVLELLRGRVSGGLVATKRGFRGEDAETPSGDALAPLRIVEAGHPVPDENSVKAAREAIRLCERADERSLFVNLISGGGSSCMALPAEPLTLEEMRATTETLLACGAAIQEINSVRKHLSAIKGGRLAAFLYPATSLNLILSDVVGDRLDAIASGLTVPDPTTYLDAFEVLKRYDIVGRVPRAAAALLERGAAGGLPETPKPGDPVFDRVHNRLVGSNVSALLAAERRARELGYRPLVLSSQISGEAREVGRALLGIAKDVARRELSCEKPACLIAGGETTVTLWSGHGLGGRNQEMALAVLAGMAEDPEGCRGVSFLAAGSDGNDGPTDAAGAFASSVVLEEARRRGKDFAAIQDHLARHDAYRFFDSLGLLFKPGLSRTNVGDLLFFCVE